MDDTVVIWFALSREADGIFWSLTPTNECIPIRIGRYGVYTVLVTFERSGQLHEDIQKRVQ